MRSGRIISRNRSSLTTTIGHTPQGRKIGAWVLKCNPAMSNLAADLAEHGRIRAWSVVESYRFDLLREGHPCVMWVTGSAGSPVPAGIYAVGEIVKNADGDLLISDRWDDSVKPVDGKAKDAVKEFVSVDMHWLQEPITKADLLDQHPEFAQAEVVRAPQVGSPSFLTPEEWELVKSVDLSNGPVSDAQLDAFAQCYGDPVVDATQLPLLYAVHPDGSSSAVFHEADGVFVLRGDLQADEDVEEFGPFGSMIDAVDHVRSTLLREQDAIPVASAGGESMPVVGLPDDVGGAAELHRTSDGWIEMFFDANGDAIDSPVVYETLDAYFDDLINELAEIDD